MPLAAISNGQTSASAQIDQFIDLLTGVMHDQPVTLRADYGVAGVNDNLVLSSNTAATKGGYLGFADAGAVKWEVGKEADNSLRIWDSVRGAFVMQIASNGDITFPSAAKVLGSADYRTAARIIAGADPGGGTAGDVIVNRGGASPGSGAIYFGSSGGSHNMLYDGTKFILTDALTIAGALAGATDITGSGITTGGILKATGAPSLGSAAAGRYVGNWTTAGPPTGLTGVVGDFGFGGNGMLWVCTVAGTPGTWVTGYELYKVHVQRSGAQTLTSGTWAAVLLDTEDYDTNGDFDAVTTHKWTCPRDGVYLIVYKTSVSTGTGRIGARLNKNSGTIIGQSVIGNVASGNISSSDMFIFAAGDTLGLEVFEDATTGSLTVSGVLGIQYLGPT